MSEDRPWDLYARDMPEACERVVESTEAMDQAAFVADARTYYATLHNLALIVQTTTNIPEPVRDSHPTTPWRSIVGALDV